VEGVLGLVDATAVALLFTITLEPSMETVTLPTLLASNGATSLSGVPATTSRGVRDFTTHSGPISPAGDRLLLVEPRHGPASARPTQEQNENGHLKLKLEMK